MEAPLYYLLTENRNQLACIFTFNLVWYVTSSEKYSITVMFCSITNWMNPDDLLSSLVPYMSPTICPEPGSAKSNDS